MFEITQQKICINSKIGLHKQKKLWYDALAEKIIAVIFGLVAQLGERSVRIREVEGSNPFESTTSEQALYRLLRLFTKVRARSCRCFSFPNRTRSAGLRFGVGCRPENCGIYSVAMLHLEKKHRQFGGIFSLDGTSYHTYHRREINLGRFAKTRAVSIKSSLPVFTQSGQD